MNSANYELTVNRKTPYGVHLAHHVGTVVVTSSDPTAAEIIADNPPKQSSLFDRLTKRTEASGYILGLKPAAGVKITAVLTLPDGTIHETAFETIDVIEPAPPVPAPGDTSFVPVPKSTAPLMSITLGAPIPK